MLFTHQSAWYDPTRIKEYHTYLYSGDATLYCPFKIVVEQWHDLRDKVYADLDIDLASSNYMSVSNYLDEDGPYTIMVVKNQCKKSLTPKL